MSTLSAIMCEYLRHSCTTIPCYYNNLVFHKVKCTDTRREALGMPAREPLFLIIHEPKTNPYLIQLVSLNAASIISFIPLSYIFRILHHIKILIEVSYCFVIHAVKHISICVECDVYIGVTKPVLQHYCRDA